MLANNNTKMKMNCPTCLKLFDSEKMVSSKPFCSERCKLIDLGSWASEKFIIKGKKNVASSESET